MLCSLLRLKCPNTNTRIADERLYLLRPWSIVATNSDTIIFLSLAISRNASQNGVSRDTLDLCPSRTMECFITRASVPCPPLRLLTTGVPVITTSLLPLPFTVPDFRSQHKCVAIDQSSWTMDQQRDPRRIEHTSLDVQYVSNSGHSGRAQRMCFAPGANSVAANCDGLSLGFGSLSALTPKADIRPSKWHVR